MSESEFEETIKLIRISMKFLGVWPDHKNYSFYRFVFIFSFQFFLLVAPQTAALINVEKDLNNIIEILTNLLAMLFISWCKLFTERRQGEGMQKILISFLIFN